MTKAVSIAERCRFQTARLSVESWQPLLSTEAGRRTLAHSMMAMLTPEVTKALPPGWQGLESISQAVEWLHARFAQGDCFTVAALEDDAIVGCLTVYADSAEADPSRLDLRIGYLFSRSAWGHGYGSELIGGLVAWCERAGDIRSLIGGVEETNAASIRVLEKNGFRVASGAVEPPMVALERVLADRSSDPAV